MKTQNVLVRWASLADLDRIAPLFDAYRRFYEQVPDLALAREFLSERLERDESAIFLALGQDGSAVGFTQLYSTFSSASAKRFFILNDLFVASSARRNGVGQALLEAAADFGRAEGSSTLTLITAHTNTTAQALYEAAGWRLDEIFRRYVLVL